MTTSTIELSARPLHRLRSPWAMGMPAAVLAVIALSLLASVDLAGHEWDLTRFLRVGERASALPFVSEDIPDTQLVPGWGHDGQANYVLAATFPDIEAAEGHLDSVSYRARRIVYPALVSPVPRGRPLAVAMVVVNVAAVAAAAVAVGELAARRGAPRIVGAVVGVTPAFVASVVIDLGDALALALVAWGAVLWERAGTTRTASLSVALFALAGLSRETTLVVPLALLAASVVAGRPPAAAGRSIVRWALLVPPAVVVTWIVALDLWIGGPGKSVAQFTFPFRGWLEKGIGGPEALTAAALVVLSVWLARRLWPADPAWAIVVAAEAAMLCCVDRGVLLDSLNLARVTAWVVPWAAIGLSAASIGDHRSAARSGSQLIASDAGR